MKCFFQIFGHKSLKLTRQIEKNQGQKRENLTTSHENF